MKCPYSDKYKECYEVLEELINGLKEASPSFLLLSKKVRRRKNCIEGKQFDEGVHKVDVYLEKAVLKYSQMTRFKNQE